MGRMTATTFIHTSDFQLGMTRWFLGEEGGARFADDREAVVLKLGEIATETGAEFIVVAGDVFEHNSLAKRTLLRAQEMFKRLPVPVYLLPGNHDPLVADSVFYKATADNVHVIADSEPIQIKEGVEIVGAPYTSKRANHDLVRAALERLEPTDGIRIAVGHGQVDSRGAEDDADVIDLSYVEDKIRAGVIDYLALGDTHSTMSLGNTGRVWFSGAPETTDFHGVPANTGEVDSGNVLVVTVDGEDVDIDKRAVGRWRFEALDREVNSEEDVDRFLKELEDYPDKIRTAIKYGLRGTVGLNAQAKLQQRLGELEEVFASLKVRDRTTDLYLEPSEEELAGMDMHGYAAAALQDLLDELDTEVGRDAANLLFRLHMKEA